MQLILGIIAITIIGIAMQIFDAVGGWPGVFLIVGAVVGGGIGLNVLVARNAAIKDLRAMPAEVEALLSHARTLSSADPAAFLRAMEAEYAAGRAPTFWEIYDEAAVHLCDLVETLERAHEVAHTYNEGADKYKLVPTTITVEDGDDQLMVEGMRNGLIEVRDAALTNTDFALVYEQRRQGQELQAQQRAMRDELAAVKQTADAALDASLQASDDARSARRAAKRASGDWF